MEGRRDDMEIGDVESPLGSKELFAHREDRLLCLGSGGDRRQLQFNEAASPWRPRPLFGRDGQDEAPSQACQHRRNFNNLRVYALQRITETRVTGEDGSRHGVGQAEAAP